MVIRFGKSMVSLLTRYDVSFLNNGATEVGAADAVPFETLEVFFCKLSKLS